MQRWWKEKNAKKMGGDEKEENIDTGKRGKREVSRNPIKKITKYSKQKNGNTKIT